MRRTLPPPKTSNKMNDFRELPAIHQSLPVIVLIEYINRPAGINESSAFDIVDTIFFHIIGNPVLRAIPLNRMIIPTVNEIELAQARPETFNEVSFRIMDKMISKMTVTEAATNGVL